MCHIVIKTYFNIEEEKYYERKYIKLSIDDIKKFYCNT